MYELRPLHAINSHQSFLRENFQRAPAFRHRAPFQYQRQIFNKRPLQNYDLEHWCETCDRSFPTSDLLMRHKQQHQKCNIDGCQFIAHPKVITKHIQMQHASGIYKKIANLNNPEDIKKWREERKKKYPTKVNIEKKEAEMREKVERGEKLGLKYDGHKKYRTGDDMRKRKRPNGNQNNQHKRHKPNVLKKTQVIPNITKTTLPKKEHDITVNNNKKLQPFTGIQDLIIDCTEENDYETQCSFEINEIDVEDLEFSKPEESIVNAVPTVCGALSSLMCDYESSEEDLDEGNGTKPKIKIENKLAPEESSTSSTKYTNNENEKSDNESGPEEIKVVKQIDPDVTKVEDNVQFKNKTKVVRKDNVPRDANRKRYAKTRSIPSTLLQKLLRKEIQQERNIVLQCIRHIVKSNFFDKSN